MRKVPPSSKMLKLRGHKVFLDLKLHDIPNTVKKAMKVLAGLGVDMCNVHAGGTVDMMKAALEGLAEGSAEKGGERPLLIAVTQLTSTTEERMRRDLLIDEGYGESGSSLCVQCEGGRPGRSRMFSAGIEGGPRDLRIRVPDSDTGCEVR